MQNQNNIQTQMTLANALTACRLVLCAPLAISTVGSPTFFALYLICGITDMLDGLVARRMATTSEFGARLDSLADFVFVIVCLAKLLPLVSIPVWIWIWIALIALLRITNMMLSKRRCGSVRVLHTQLNKLTGLVLFVLPFFFVSDLFMLCAIVACIVASMAAAQETVVLFRRERQNSTIKVNQ